MKGASSRASVVRHAYNVWWAASFSESSVLFQKRRRLRRTYQVDSRSTNASMRRAPSVGL